MEKKLKAIFSEVFKVKISEINEGHRIAALSWDKFSRNLRIQLIKMTLFWK